MTTDETTKIFSPFTPEQVEALNRWQHSNCTHPFTCGNRGDGKHGEYANDTGALVATVRGWICLFCDYTQDWAHSFMVTPIEKIESMQAAIKRAKSRLAGVPIPRVDAYSTKTVK